MVDPVLGAIFEMKDVLVAPQTTSSLLTEDI